MICRGFSTDVEVPYRHVNTGPYRHVNNWILDTGYSILDSRFWILDDCYGSFVNLAKLDNLVK